MNNRLLNSSATNIQHGTKKTSKGKPTDARRDH